MEATQYSLLNGTWRQHIIPVCVVYAGNTVFPFSCYSIGGALCVGGFKLIKSRLHIGLMIHSYVWIIVPAPLYVVYGGPQFCPLSDPWW